MNKVYAILGSGMQGTALAYDLARFAHPAHILMGDRCFDTAKSAAWRVNELVGSAVCAPEQVNALDPDSLRKFLKDVEVVASCVPYWMHSKVAPIAVETRTSMIDLGGDTDVTLEVLELDEHARAAGVAIVPDCGLAPGLVNNLAMFMVERMDSADTIKLYCGVLPQHPQPPLSYMLTFNVEGLVAEYDSHAVVLRDGRIELIPTLTELETLRVDQLGEMEAFVTSGGSSTAPYTLQGKVRNYEYKTVRYPGHCAIMGVFKEFGFWSHEPVEIRGCKVKPVELFHKLFGEKLAEIEDQDLCVVRAIGTGTLEGKPHRIQIDIFDKQDESTGFTSMERLTGFSAAIYAHAIGAGEIGPGAHRYEGAMTGERFVQELGKRGFAIEIS
jgi:lysine 6-dehydrogenase